MIYKKQLMRRLRGLKQNKEKTDAEIEKMADDKIEAYNLRTSFAGLKEEEIDKATELYLKYVTEFSLESLAEKSTLVNMVYKEILKTRIQEFIKTEGESKQGAIPLHMIEKMMELDAQILSDKEKLGMLKKKESGSFVEAMEELKHKVLNYYNTHGGEIYYKCPYCQQLSRQIMQLEGYEVEKATFFKGTTLYNVELMNLYHQKILTIEQVAKILGVHQKYVTFIYDNIYLRKDDSKNQA